MRALIFDLDDTLIDTHGQLVREAHWQACLAMSTAGLSVEPTELFETRLRLLSEAPRAEINARLAQHYDCTDPEVIQAGFEAYFNPVLTELDLFPGLRPLLEHWSEHYDLHLVTSGYTRTQQRKVELLKIAPLFQDIKYVDIHQPEGKYHAFEQIRRSGHYQSEQIAVIGDRITNEIVAGNRLGMKTIWIRYGECAHIPPQSPEEEPDHTLTHILGLKALLTEISTPPNGHLPSETRALQYPQTKNSHQPTTR